MRDRRRNGFRSRKIKKSGKKPKKPKKDKKVPK